MTEYNIVSLFFIICTLASFTVKARIDIFAYLCISLILSVTGLRSSVGTDYDNYKNLFYDNAPVEPLFRFIINIFNRLDFPFWVFLLFLCACICLLIICNSLILFSNISQCRQSTYRLARFHATSVILSISTSGMMGSMRTALAFSLFMLLVTITVLYSKSNFKNIIFLVLGYSSLFFIHYSMLLWVVIFFGSLLLVQDKPLFVIKFSLRYSIKLLYRIFMLLTLSALVGVILLNMNIMLDLLKNLNFVSSLSTQVLYKIQVNLTDSALSTHQYVNFITSGFAMFKSFTVLIPALIFYNISYSTLDSKGKKYANFLVVSLIISTGVQLLSIFSPPLHLFHSRSFAYINKYIFLTLLFFPLLTTTINVRNKIFPWIIFAVSTLSIIFFYGAIFANYELFVPYKSILWL